MASVECITISYCNTDKKISWALFTSTFIHIGSAEKKNSSTEMKKKNTNSHLC